MTKTPKLTGRPPKKKRDSIYTSALYQMFREDLPLVYLSPDGRVNTLKLAEKMDCQRMTIYRWFNGGNMSVKAVNALSELSAAGKCERKGRLTKEKLLPFCGL